MVIWQIDDDPLQLELAAILIRRASPAAVIHSFGNARDAAVRLAGERPDLIMLDLNMPEMDGWAFLDTVQGQPDVPRVVVLTSSIDPRDKARAFGYDCVKAFLVKPVHNLDLAELGMG